MINIIVCAMRGHRVNRKKVWWDSINFRTNCTQCGRALLRDDEGWRPFNQAEADEGDLRRGAH